MVALTEYQRKYLVRLSANVIDRYELERWGKRPVATMLSLHKRGLVECTAFDGDGSVEPTSEDEYWWAITNAGLAAIDKA